MDNDNPPPGHPLQDNRSRLAKARDEWLESPEGQSCTGTNILRNPGQRQFLENRLVSAFIAGADWASKNAAGKANSVGRGGEKL